MEIEFLKINIKRARTEALLSQAKLAQLSDVSAATISQYEQGNTLPPLEKLCLIAKATNKPLCWFFMDDVKQEMNMNLGKNIIAARKAKGMNQSDLAHSINVNNSSVSSYESGKKTPSLPVLTAIAKVTEKPLYWLFMTEEEQAEWSGEKTYESDTVKRFAEMSHEEQCLALEAFELVKKMHKIAKSINLLD